MKFKRFSTLVSFCDGIFEFHRAAVMVYIGKMSTSVT